jgi:DNA repair photolyase
VPRGAEPRAGDAVRLVAQPVHGLCPPLHVLSIITRGPLILRDLDVLIAAARRTTVGVTFSIPTLDPDIWRTTEPGTAPPHQRLRALQELVKAGLDVGVGMAPILPGLSDRPELLPAYERLYERRAYLPAEETKPIREQVRELARAAGVRDRRTVRLEPPADAEQLSLAV